MSYSSGGYGYGGSFLTTKNKPKKATIALFQALQSGPLRKGVLNEVMATVNGHDNPKSYCDSTIAWHTDSGRFLRVREGRYSIFSLTQKGIKYAQERGIF
jgi:hypothetical protein